MFGIVGRQFKKIVKVNKLFMKVVIKMKMVRLFKF